MIQLKYGTINTHWQYTPNTLIIHIPDTRAEIQMQIQSLIHKPRYAIEIPTLIHSQYAGGYAEVIRNNIHDTTNTR